MSSQGFNDLTVSLGTIALQCNTYISIAEQCLISGRTIEGYRRAFQALDVGSESDQLQQLFVLVNRVTFLHHATVCPFRLCTPSNGQIQNHDEPTIRLQSNSLRKGISTTNTRHHHVHILLNVIQADDVNKVEHYA